MDIYPTLTDLAGLPPPTSEPYLDVDSISALPLFTQFEQPGTRTAGGSSGGQDVGSAGEANAETLNAAQRTHSFSQYPRCEGAGPAVEQGNCNSTPKQEFK